jgi:hypothetical protein
MFTAEPKVKVRPVEARPGDGLWGRKRVRVPRGSHGNENIAVVQVSSIVFSLNLL